MRRHTINEPNGPATRARAIPAAKAYRTKSVRSNIKIDSIILGRPDIAGHVMLVIVMMGVERQILRGASAKQT